MAGICKPWTAIRAIQLVAALLLVQLTALGEPKLTGPKSVHDHGIRLLTPKVIELWAIVDVPEQTKRPSTWDFANDIPEPGAFEVRLDGNAQAGLVKKVGFRRRPSFAPLGKWDLRVEAAIYLELSRPIRTSEHISVQLNGGEFADSKDRFTFEIEASPRRLSPAIHVSQVGYQTGSPKTARAGYYLANLGELELTAERFPTFYLRDEQTGSIIYRSNVTQGSEEGFTYEVEPCQHVLVLDFSEFDKEGTYRVGIDGLGESLPFPIGKGIHACLARTMALGLYHQRCGCRVGMPWSRFEHSPCHTAKAKVPAASDSSIWKRVAKIYDNDHENQIAPSLSDAKSHLYPFRRKGEIDVSGGHHDAGDYSKYTINSAQLIHFLTYAVDTFPGVDKIDNLGIPESGNGIPDALDIAAWEAAFLAKMQDSDGGFYFLVYPRERSYETDVSPDKGDLQTVFPKNTACTAAAGAALCQIASSPEFARRFPVAAKRYLQQARIAWRFIVQAHAKHGETGAYQTISHYGNNFMDRDEIAWLATELYLATGEQRYHRYLLDQFKPGAPGTAHWGWLRMQEGYGAAARSYAAAPKSGRR